MEKEEVKFEQPSEALLIVNRYLVPVMAVIVLAVLIVGYFFFLNPKIEDIKLTKEETTVSQEARQRNEELLFKIKELKEEYEDIKTSRIDQLNSLRTIVPEGEQIAELFVMADRLAVARDFRLDSIDIVDNEEDQLDQIEEEITESESDSETEGLPEELQEFVGDEPKEEKLAGLKSLLIHLNVSKVLEEEEEEDVRGTPREERIDPEEQLNIYDDFKGYLQDLENNLRLMDIRTVTFGDFSEGGGAFSFSIITYYR